jgi:hypothetical protein
MEITIQVIPELNIFKTRKFATLSINNTHLCMFNFARYAVQGNCAVFFDAEDKTIAKWYECNIVEINT